MPLFSSPFLPEPKDPHALNATAAPRAAGPIGVLLVNLGTPDQPTAAAIRRYLSEFLSDARVIELPSWLWQLVLQGIILNLRPRKLAPRYKEIWLEKGSPLLVYSQAQAQGLQQALDAHAIPARVALGMRYGRPSIAAAIDQLRAQGCERILTVPMYPQYAASTTATAVDAVAACAARLRNQPELRFIKRYYDEPAYLDALAGRLRQTWEQQGKPQRLLLSFHGLPQQVIEQGDPYYRDCVQTAELLKKRLGADAGLVHVAFQSRFGAQKWIEPYTQPTLVEWAQQGITQVDVMCPGFLADCLETLEEIQMQCRDAFLAAGGRQFRYIPCLNDDPGWIAGLEGLVIRHLQGWLPLCSEGRAIPGKP